MTPFFILMISIRLMITPLYAKIEYQMPGFPEDPFGFTRSDRLTWSEPSIKYLVNEEDISYLSTLRFENGDPIYNQRELSHMEDVKIVVRGMRYALAGTGLILLTSTIFLITKRNKKLFCSAFVFWKLGINRVNWCHYCFCFDQFQSIIYVVSPVIFYQWYLDVLHL